MVTSRYFFFLSFLGICTPSDLLPPSVKIWNIAERRVLAMFEGQRFTIRSVDFSPDGRFLVSSSYDGSVCIWHLRDGTSRKLTDANPSIVTSVVFSPNGRYVAAADSTGMVQIWNFRTGQLLERWGADTQWLWSVIFTPDGKALWSGGNEKTLKSWDVSSLTRSRSTVGMAVDGKKEMLKFRQHTVCCSLVTSFFIELIFLLYRIRFHPFPSYLSLDGYFLVLMIELFVYGILRLALGSVY